MAILKFFERIDSIVSIDIDSELGTCKPIYPFSYDCGGDQQKAELLKRHLNNQLDKFKREIALDALSYLGPNEITRLKKKLKSWNSSIEGWGS